MRNNKNANSFVMIIRLDIVDDSGLRFYYTTPRKYDAAILWTGLSVNEYMTIPPKQENWTTTGYCSKHCTEQVISLFLPNRVLYF